MIRIIKTKEPKSWTRHRLTEGAEYEASEELRDTLLKDQGYLCAYCMRRIPICDQGTSEMSRIEHVKPQNTLTKMEAMDFSNMVICCPGAISTTRYQYTHCDRHKGENTIRFSPFDDKFIDTISYKSDGSIESSNKEYDQDLNEILNLNIPLLKKNRKAVKDSLVKALGKREWKRRDLERLLTKFKSKDENGYFKEYCGVVISYLNKRLRQTR